MTSSQDQDALNSDSKLPLEDPGISSRSSLTTSQKRSIPLRSLLLVVPLSIMLGGILGLYFQPPGLRAFFSVTGLEPGAGTDTPIAVALKQVESGEKVSVESEGNVLALGRLIPMGDVASVSIVLAP